MDLPSVYKAFIIEEADIPYEEDILKNPYSVKAWLRYLEHKRTAPRAVRNLVYERALKEIPGSYKIWYAYLRERRRAVKNRSAADPMFEDLNNAYERCLVFMHKMPRMWIDYLTLLIQQCKITRTRHTFDRALKALPITQHHRLWPMYLKFVGQHNVPETAVRVWRRYLKLESNDVEDFIDYLKRIGRLDEAAQKLADVVNNDKFVSKHGKTQHQLWSELCELLSKHSAEIHSVRAEPIIRAGIARFSDMVGRLWVSLAEYHTRRGHFGKARDVYEEGIQTVTTVRDFSTVFDAYAQFEETMISSLMERLDMGEPDVDDVEVDMCMARFELLMDRRPLLVNSVLLRQNPHNVAEWLKRAKLYADRPHLVIATFTEAVQTVDPGKASGKLSDIWVAFAKYYEDHDQLPEARAVFDKAVTANFKKVDDLANVWCEYVEMELRHNNTKRALSLARQATTPQSGAGGDGPGEYARRGLYRSLRVWTLYVDLEESLGSFESVRAVYDRILDLRIATPQIIINYAILLEENKYFEEAFKVYERGVGLFEWPFVFDLYIVYINKFIARYGGSKLERARDIIEQALDGAPPKYAKDLYLAYARLEEDHGLARHAIAVYDRAVKHVAPEDKLELFRMYVRKASELFGITRTREIYEKAIEMLPDSDAAAICLQYAQLEVKLGEIDRARAIYSYAAQMCDPRTQKKFWDSWHDFEVKCGNEDTFRDMLRTKRSVQAAFSTKMSTELAAQMVAQKAAAAGGQQVTFTAAAQPNAMRELEQEDTQGNDEEEQDGPPKLKEQVQFVSSRPALGQMADNPHEIELDDESESGSEASDGEEKEKESNVRLQQQAIPSSVFGGLKTD